MGTIIFGGRGFFVSPDKHLLNIKDEKIAKCILVPNNFQKL